MNFLDLPLSDELKDTFTKATAKQSNIRYLKIRIISEKLELAGTGNCGTTSLDFNSFQKSMTTEEACYIAFRYKDSFAESPWAFIMYTPDSLSVKERTVYASSFGAARDALGFKFFSKIKRYSTPSDFMWIQFQNSDSEKLESSKGGINAAKSSSSAGAPAVTNTSNPPSSEEAKPWSQKELLLQQLERDEEIARREYEQKAVAVIGLAKVAFPITDPVSEAITQLQEGTHNWIQICLNNPPTQIELVECKTLSDDEIVSSVDIKNPQFYLYNRNNTLIIIYCCPEQQKGENFAQGRQIRMVYATAKTSLYESIVNLNLNLSLKKYDIVEPKELETSTLLSHLQSKTSEIKNAKQLQGSVAYNSNNNNRPAGRVGAKPVYNPGQPVSLASVMANNNNVKKPLPKGVVIPPKGAHC